MQLLNVIRRGRHDLILITISCLVCLMGATVPAQDLPVTPVFPAPAASPCPAACRSTGWPSNEFTIAGGQAIFTGNGANQEVITHSRSLSTAITVGTLDTATINFDLIIGPTDGQAGRGIGVNFLSSDGIVFTLGKKINGNIGVFADGIGTGSAQLSGATITRVAGTTYALSTTLTYDGVDTTFSLTDGTATLSATLAGTQVTLDAIQLTGYHNLTTGNGVDNFSIEVTTIPEPATAVLILVGLGAFLMKRRRA